MTTELNTLVTALYVKIDDEWAGTVRLPGRPPKLSHSELLCLAAMQALLGFHSEARWLRHLRAHYRHLFPYIPQDSGYNKRLRAALPQVKRVIRTLAKDTDFWHDTVWIADSTPVP
ncbi:IS982 family transposase, partial [Actinacidiphila glaucinigra]